MIRWLSIENGQNLFWNDYILRQCLMRWKVMHDGVDQLSQIGALLARVGYEHKQGVQKKVIIGRLLMIQMGNGLYSYPDSRRSVLESI